MKAESAAAGAPPPCTRPQPSGALLQETVFPLSAEPRPQ